MYKIRELSELAGVSARALRHFEELGLLAPGRDRQNGYRVYTGEDVDRLQQVLFYRELGLPLSEIGRLMRSPGYEAGAALFDHLAVLKARRARLDTLISTVEKTIVRARGEIDMEDKEKFEGFKKKMVDDNERRYGKEARSRYGDAAVDAAKAVTDKPSMIVLRTQKGKDCTFAENEYYNHHIVVKDEAYHEAVACLDGIIAQLERKAGA